MRMERLCNVAISARMWAGRSGVSSNAKLLVPAAAFCKRSKQFSIANMHIKLLPHHVLHHEWPSDAIGYEQELHEAGHKKRGDYAERVLICLLVNVWTYEIASCLLLLLLLLLQLLLLPLLLILIIMLIHADPTAILMHTDTDTNTLVAFFAFFWQGAKFREGVVTRKAELDGVYMLAGAREAAVAAVT